MLFGSNHNSTMRNLRMVFLICSAALTAGRIDAQSVSMHPISATSFCAGDPIAVSFTVTGFFGHKNVFTLQLSDPTGSFSNGFQNLASLSDTLPGTFTINTKIGGLGTHYRLRIMAAVPYMTSADNGSDISIGSAYWPNMSLGAYGPGTIGTPIKFFVADDMLDPRTSIDYTVFWDFGQGATPQTATANVRAPESTVFSSATYSTPGHKTATLRYVGAGGCSSGVTDTIGVDIYDCSVPVIPHDAIVINADTIFAVSGFLKPSTLKALRLKTHRGSWRSR